MEFRAVGKRCAVALDCLHLPISPKEALAVLINKGFKIVEIDIIALARRCISTSKYRRGARFLEAPETVDCSSLIKWLYAQRGVWLPRRTIQQRELGEVIDNTKLIAGDVVFVSGWIDWYVDNPKNGVGHVGIVTNDNTIIHAEDRKTGVVEVPFGEFFNNSTFRGARRYITKGTGALTLEVPDNIDVETANDIQWIILQTLPR